jgi:hypothetical protein
MTTHLTLSTSRWGTVRRRLGPAATKGFLGACLAACSLQNFDYLTEGPSDAGTDSGPSQQGPDADLSDARADAAPADGGFDVQPDARDASAAIDVGVVGPDSMAPTDASAESEAGPAPPALVNPSFEQAYSGWTFDPATAMGKYAYTQYPSQGGYTIDGQFELATYSATDSFMVAVSQTLTNVPDGTYRFSGHFNCGVNNAAYVYSTMCGGADQRANIPVTVTTTSWEVVSVDIAVTGGSCTVGFFVSASPTDFLNTDAFTFALVPSPDGGDGGDAGGE